MPMSVAFRWKTPNIQVSKGAMEQDGWNRGLSDLSDSIRYAKESRYKKAQDARRNRIEDEDRQRRIDEEERRKKVWGETADMMRSKADERAALVKRADEIRNRIAALQAQLGG